jgi:ABC-type transport system involved in multi-copper enzyme maturation permease subunit
MTAPTVLRAPARLEEDAGLRPMPWRRMAWVIWRQHRVALIGMTAALGALAVWLWIAGLQLHHAYAAAIACQPASSLYCSGLSNAFDGMNVLLAKGIPLQVVPPLIGAFLGAPVLAREMESGTFRFAWTQGFGRWRWTLAKLVGLGVVVTAAAGALSILMSWYYQPYFSGGNQGLFSANQVTIGASPLAPGLFDVRGVSFAAWTLAAFTIGVVAGLLIRRAVPAIVSTLVAYTGLAVAAGGFLRQHYLTPLVANSLNVPGSAWIISQQWTKGGRPVSEFVVSQALRAAPGSVAGKGGIPNALTTMQYLAQHGYTQLDTYQPASRFWPFQWIEGGWLLTLSLLLFAVAVWLVRRRAV